MNGATRALNDAEHRLEVLVAVVQVDRQVVLAALVTGERRSLDMAAEAAVDQVVGQPAGALGDVGPGETAIAEHEALGVGPCLADRFQDLGKAEFGDG